MTKFKITKRHRSMAIGIACGLACAICVGLYIAQVDEKAQAAQEEMLAEYGGEQIDVCVARHDIPAGQVVSDGDIEIRTWVATLLPPNAVRSASSVVGRQVGSTILEGEVLSEARFGFEADAIEIPPGTVAVSVPTREVQAVGGAVGAGMACDVYAVGPSSTSRLAKSVPVLATSMSTDGSSTNAWVTLAISPGSVQEVVAASENLEIYLTLPSNARSNDSDGIDENFSSEESAESATPEGDVSEKGSPEKSSTGKGVKGSRSAGEGRS